MNKMKKQKVGRPYSDNPRAYFIPETRMTREESRMVTLKAALYSGGNKAEFIRQAANRFEGDIKTLPCMETGCAGTMHPVTTDDYHNIKVGDEQYQIVLHGMPVFQCDVCETREMDMNFTAEVEKAIDNEIEWRLQHRQPVPKEIDFHDLITV